MVLLFTRMRDANSLGTGLHTITMPLETQYSDDTSFSNCRKKPQVDLYPVCKKVFGEWNLSVNDSKSEHPHFYLAKPKPQNRKKLVPGVEVTS